MNLVMLIILWFVFIVMYASMLFYAKPMNGQILGVTLSREHGNHSDVQVLLRRYRISCLMVLIVSVAISFLLLIGRLARYAEFLMLFLLILNLAGYAYVAQQITKRLLEMKEKHGWVYPRKHIIAVDLNVTRQKGQAGVSPFFIYIFLPLSLIPTAFLLFEPKKQAIYPLIFSFIGPLCQVLMTALYFQLKNKQIYAYSENSEKNQEYAVQTEKLGAMAGTLFAFAMLLFWFAFSSAIIFSRNTVLVIFPAIFLIATMVMIGFWYQHQSIKLENHILGELVDAQIYEKGKQWTWGMYNDSSDPRIFVPKRVAGFGWTINIGRPAGKLISLGFVVFMVLIMIGVLYCAAKDYEFIDNGTSVTIDAAMYDITIEKENITSVSMLEELPPAVRTSGYGGMEKSFGHFNLEGYGPVMMYIYCSGGGFVFVEIQEQTPKYVIVSGKTPEETRDIYDDFMRWSVEKNS